MDSIIENEKVRLFIALDIPSMNDQNDPIQFANAQLLISQAIQDFRPVKSFHVTLVFIGSVNESFVPKIKTAIEHAVAQFIHEQKRDLPNGIGQLMIKPGAMIMGKNAVAVSLMDNYLIEALIATLFTLFQQQQIPHAAPHDTLHLHVTIGRVPVEYKKQIEIKRFLDLLPAPIGGRAQLNETFTASTITLYQSCPNSEYIPLAVYTI